MIVGALSYLSQTKIDTETLEPIPNAYSSWFSILSLLVVPALTCGFVSACLRSTRKRNVETGELFSGFKLWGKVTIANILMSIYIFLWALLFIIPGIVAAYKYRMTIAILLDNPDMSANEAITASKELMRGHKGNMFCLDLSFIGWWLLCILTAGILSIWVYPHMICTQMEYYKYLNKLNNRHIDSQPTSGKTDSYGEPI